MIGILVLSSTFMIIILLIVLMIAVNVRNAAIENHKQSKRIFKELSDRVGETQNLFRIEVTAILNNINKVIDKN